jgi:hypothetical protein
MDPVIIQFTKFNMGCTAGMKAEPKVMILASDISSIEECHLHAIDEDGAKDFHFIYISMKNGNNMNVCGPIEDVMQKWQDGLKLASGDVSFDV